MKLKLFPDKYCKCCGKKLERKFFEGCNRWESTGHYEKRMFCDRKCQHNYGKAHRLKDERLYTIYRNMRSRCENPRNPSYKWYGAKGISICDEWKGECGYMSFKKWALKAGYSDDLTIDRVNVQGNYEPSNCRWATIKTQANNRRNNNILSLGGESHTVSEWADILGTTYGTLKTRINLGWSVEDVLTKPICKDQRLDISGDKYNRLTAIKMIDKPSGRKQNGVYWLCKCDCGNDVITTLNSLRTGNTKSCGCLGREKLYARNNAMRNKNEIKGA